MSRHAVLLCAVLGAVASAVSTIASWWVIVGATPSWVYDIFGSMHLLSTHRWRLGVPLEYIEMLVFLSIAALASLSNRVMIKSWAVWTTTLGIGLTGYAAWTAFAVLKGQCWGADVIALLAGLIVCVGSCAEYPSLRTLRSEVVRVTRLSVTRPRARATLTAAFAVLFGCALGLRLTAMSPPENAAERVFLRWYASQTRHAAYALRSPASVRVVAYVDYQCPACATSSSPVQKVIDRLRAASSIPIDLVVRNFPADSACNPSIAGRAHPAACKAAVAATLVKQHLGEHGSAEFSKWLYENFRTLSEERIDQRIKELGLAGELANEHAALLAQVVKEAESGAEIGVTGTPTFVVDGIVLKPGAAGLASALEFELKRRNARPVGTR